ncbi:MAG: diguanylate cyclase domain-containing protein [Novosphingobium sp.]
MAIWTGKLNWLWPPAPEEVRDALVLSQYERMRGLAPLLYAAIILIICAAVAGSSDTPWSIRLAIPAVVLAICLCRLVVWVRRPRAVPTIAAARCMVWRSEWISSLTAIPCAIWCIQSYLFAAPERAMYFPMFMAMGSLATTFCLSMLRIAPTVHIATGLGPIAIAMIVSQDRITMSAGASMLVTAGFLLALLRYQQEKFIELLQLQVRMVQLSQTDPLTGLANRRALQERLETSVNDASLGHGPSVLLLDLDGFKPVNDRHGHAAGDEVLREVARRLELAVGADGIASRIGGDEFAVLVLPGSQRRAETIGTAVLGELARPFEFEGHRLHVGASLGIAVWPDDGTTLDQLLRVADRALYVAKAGQDGGEGTLTRVHPLRKA